VRWPARVRQKCMQIVSMLRDISTALHDEMDAHAQVLVKTAADLSIASSREYIIGQLASDQRVDLATLASLQAREVTDPLLALLHSSDGDGDDWGLLHQRYVRLYDLVLSLVDRKVQNFEQDYPGTCCVCTCTC
jgi:hypothetical protein